MSPARFVTGVQFYWHDMLYEVLGLVPGRNVNLVALDTGAVQTVSYMALVASLFQERSLQFVVTGKAAKRRTDGKPSTTYDYIDLGNCPPHLVEIARWRLEVIQPLLQLAPARCTRQLVHARVVEMRSMVSNANQRSLRTSVSVTSIYQWIKDYTTSGHDLRALIPRTHTRGGAGVRRVSTDLDAMVTKVITAQYYRRERVTIDDLHQLVAAELDNEDRHLPPDQRRTPPSRVTIFRRVKELDMREVLAAKHGRRTARKQFQQYGTTDYPTLPLQRVEIDHTRTDLIVIDDQDNLPLGRLTLTYCLDMATRYPLGYYLGFEPPSYYAVAECLHHAICPKESVKERYGTEHDWQAHGLFAALVIDNGKEFIGKDLRDAAALLGFVIEVCPVQTPEFKGGVERALGTLATSFFHTLPGTTFSNPQQRGDYNSAQEACIYLSEIDRLLHLYIVDHYAERQHKGLGGVPARTWERHLQDGFLPLLPPSADELAILLGQVETRRVWQYGIEWDNLRYNCPELADIRTRVKDQPVKVKRQPSNLSRIFVYDDGRQQYLEVPVVRSAEEYTHGLSLWKHRVVCAWTRAHGDTVDLAALGRAKQQIQALVDASRERKKVGQRTRIARWETGGRPARDLAVAPGLADPAAFPAPEVLPAELPSALPTDTNIFTLPAEGWEIGPMPSLSSTSDSNPSRGTS